MTTHDRLTLAVVLVALAVLALYTGAVLQSALAIAVGIFLAVVAFALTFDPPENHP